MKLNKSKLLETLRQINNGKTSYQARKVADISVRRIYQIKQIYNKTGEIHILCRIKHPQSNGKIERWFGCYDKHREAFKSVEEFLHWYNDIKPHRSLNFKVLETPSQAFIRKLKK